MVFAIIAWFIIGYLVWVVFCTRRLDFDVYSDIEFVAMIGLVASWVWPAWLLVMVLITVTRKLLKHLED